MFEVLSAKKKYKTKYTLNKIIKIIKNQTLNKQHM